MYYMCDNEVEIARFPSSWRNISPFLYTRRNIKFIFAGFS